MNVMGINKFLFSALAIASVSILSCGSKTPKASANTQSTSGSALVATITANDNSPVATECFSPKFSYRGDQILYICQEKCYNSQPQLFLEDLNTGYRKQVTFQDGDLKGANFLRPDLLVYLSSTDTKKEKIPLLNPSLTTPTNELEIYSFDLRSDEIERVTDNHSDELMLAPLKHIDPKLALVRFENNMYKVFLKNLNNNSEKLMFKTNYPISELGVNDANQLLIVEDTGYKKLVRLIENEKKQTLWPEFKRESQFFTLDSKTGELEYLENMKVKSMSLKNLCENEVFSLTEPVLDFQKSPLSENLYVYTTMIQGLRLVERKVIPRNPTQSCKKIVRKR